MPKTPFEHYADELAQQSAAWQRKKALRALYRRWYARVVAALSPRRPTVEIGSGCGNFKAYCPDVVATDAIAAGEWIDRVVDARELPFAEGEVGNFVLIDVLHHLPRPLAFLRSAGRALQAGGRIVILEPACTPAARAVWRFGHHEPVDLSQDILAEDGTPEPTNEGFAFSNMATAWILFRRRARAATMARLPGLRALGVRYSDFLIYPATGGFSYSCFVPGFAVPALHRLESILTWPTASWLTGLRMLVVLEKTDG